MTEKEQYHTAKLYIDKLACGINPLDNVEMHEDELLNNVYMCRMFNFVSDVLGKVIENDYMITIPNRKKSKFRITENQREVITISENPVKLTVISHRVQRALDPDVKTVSGIRMAQWLEKEGMLESVMRNGRMHREATKKGNAIGISTKVEKQGDKEYVSNLYDMNAQAFIIANLENIASYQDIRNSL